MKSTLREEELVYLRAKLDEKYIVEALQGILENDPEKYILDVGCGIGGSAERIKTPLIYQPQVFQKPHL